MCSSGNEQTNYKSSTSVPKCMLGRGMKQIFKCEDFFLCSWERVRVKEKLISLVHKRICLKEHDSRWLQFPPLSPPPPPEILPIHALFLKFFSLSLTQRLHLPFCVTSPSTLISPFRPLSRLKSWTAIGVFLFELHKYAKNKTWISATFKAVLRSLSVSLTYTRKVQNQGLTLS